MRRLDELVSESSDVARGLLETTSIGVQYLSTEGKVRWANAATLRLLASGPGDYTGRAFSEFHADPSIFELVLRRLRSGKATCAYEADLRALDGTQRHMAIALNAHRQHGEIVYPCFLFDITARKVAEGRLRQLALHDPLTRVPNRTFLTGVLRRALARHRRDRLARFALLLLDLDRFKEINDRMGHVVGDRLLKEVSRRIVGCCRGSDTIARLGGDEFAVLLETVRDDEEACFVAKRIHRAISEPLVVGSTTLYVTASIGVAMARRDGSPDSVLHDADVAMYRAKARGRGNTELAFAGPAPAAAGYDELLLAVEKEDHLLQFQPILSLRTGAIVGLEAMVRLRRGDGSLIYPADFVALAESTGLMARISRWVVRTAIQRGREWQLLHPATAPFVAANVSPVVAASAGFAEEVLAALAESELAPASLWLEVNEETLVDERVTRALLRLSDAGVRLALDDFGSRYTSFLRLKELPIHAVKMDAGAMKVPGSARDTTLWRGLIGLAHDLGMTVVAEGVEEPGQVDEARRLGCDLGQGYCLSQPLGVEAVTELLAVPPEQQATVIRSGPSRAATPEPSTTATPKRPERSRPAVVLLVEDDAESRELLAELLLVHGYEVATANNGVAALESIQQGLRPDLIILDLMMPGMDGWTLRSRLREDPELGSIPIVVLSGVVDEGAAGDLAPAAWLTKPVSFRHLEEAIRRSC